MFVLCELVFSSVIGLSHLGEFCNSFVKYGAFVQRILGTFLTGMKIEQQRTAPAHWRFSILGQKLFFYIFLCASQKLVEVQLGRDPNTPQYVWTGMKSKHLDF